MDTSKFMGSLSSFGQRLKPYAENVGQSVVTLKQWSQEKLGTAEEVTELPAEYRDLEKRMDAIRELHWKLYRLGYVFQHPSFVHPAPAMTERVTSFTHNLQQFALGPDQPVSDEPDQPKNLPQALAQICKDGAKKVTTDDPLGAALQKYAQTMDKVGEEELAMCKDVTDKTVVPLSATLNTTIHRAMQARKKVQNTRLRLDAAKARFKAALPERQHTIRSEVETIEDDFVSTVEEALKYMKAVLEDPEPLRNLADLVAAQLAYYKKAHELLQEIAPEIDEMQVTQEALYRNSRVQEQED